MVATRRTFVAVSLLALSLAVLARSGAHAIDLLSIDTARFESNWTLNGSAMSTTRSKLLHPGNFGLGGIIEPGVTVSDTAAEIDAALLAGFDILFIGYFEDTHPNAFSAAELDAIVDWVAGGGSLLVTCDAADFDAVCERLGVPITSGGGTFVSAAGAGFSHPALVGPFGTVRQVEASGSIGNFDPAVGGTVVLRDDASGAPIGLVGGVGDGRVVALGDVDLISNFTLSGGTGFRRPNDALLLNVIAWLAREFVGGTCVPDNSTLCIDDVDGDGRFRVTVTYDTVLGGGLAGTALASPLAAVGAERGGLFTFFDPANPELLLKILNGCGITGHYWVYFSAGTNAGFTVTIDDLEVAGAEPEYRFTNPDLSSPPSVQDIFALPCTPAI